VTALLVLQLALAQAPSDRVSLMDMQMREYFGGEQSESYVWGAMGAVGVASGIALALQQERVAHGAAFPLMGIGLLQLALGVGLFVRTPGQVSALADQLQRDPSAFAAAERARMTRVNRGFQWYRPVEQAILVGGAGCVVLGGLNHSEVLIGVGLGTFLEAALMLVLDYFADERAAIYARRLDAFAF
jgi:hypothetical protein